jgi:hypothetical protein
MNDAHFATTSELMAYGMRSGDAICRIHDSGNDGAARIMALRNWYKVERQWLERNWYPSLALYLP